MTNSSIPRPTFDLATHDYDRAIASYSDAADAFRDLDAMLTCDCADATATYRATCLHDRRDSTLRNLLIDPDATDLDPDFDAPAADRDAIRALLLRLIHDANDFDHSTSREQLTRLALDHSLCPYHFIDYAICFDDRDPTCATIRLILPAHDT